MRVILIIRFPYMQSVEYRLKHGHNERSRHSSNAMPYISANRNPPNISHRKAFHVSAPHIAIAPRVRQPAAIALSRIRIGSIDVRMPTKTRGTHMSASPASTLRTMKC